MKQKKIIDIKSGLLSFPQRLKTAIVSRVRNSVNPIVHESVAICAPSRNWPIKPITNAFLIANELPSSLRGHSELENRFLINQNLGFPAQYLVNIPDAMICGRTGFVIVDHEAYLAEGNWRTSNVSNNPLVTSRCSTCTSNLSGHYYYIGSFYSQSYHHWHWDDLPRLVSCLPHLHDQTKFLLKTPLQEFQSDSLRALGISEEKIILIGEGDRFEVQVLQFATPLGHSEYAATSDVIAKHLAQVLRLPDRMPVEDQCRLFVSRRKANYRRIVNEDEIIEIACRHGFQHVVSEDLSYREQVELFSSASIICGSHGAGLTNQLFASPPCKILELFEPLHGRAHYWMMANALGHSYDCVVGVTVDERSKQNLVHDPDFWIDPNVFQQAVVKSLVKANRSL